MTNPFTNLWGNNPDLNQAGSTVYHVGPLLMLWYRLQALAACAVSGKLHLLDWLEAQAVHETGHYKSKGFAIDRNPFGAHHGSWFPRQSGFRDVPGEGRVGIYTGWNAYFKAWSDRLGWDDIRKVDTYVESPAEYFQQVQQKGYNPSPDYPNRILPLVPSVGWFQRSIGRTSRWVNRSLGSYKWILRIALLGLTAFLLFKLYGAWKRRKTRKRASQRRKASPRGRFDLA